MNEDAKNCSDKYAALYGKAERLLNRQIELIDTSSDDQKPE